MPASHIYHHDFGGKLCTSAALLNCVDLFLLKILKLQQSFVFSSYNSVVLWIDLPLQQKLCGKSKTVAHDFVFHRRSNREAAAALISGKMDSFLYILITLFCISQSRFTRNWEVLMIISAGRRTFVSANSRWT